MTRMIPATIHSRVRSGAERRIFRTIERSVGSDDWVCLHSLSLARHPTKRRAEIDFLVVTPRGVFVLEVKGGRIRREVGIWIFTDRYGDEHRRAEGPFDQAASAMFALERTLRERFASEPSWGPLFAYGVVLPDIEFAAMGPEGDAELVYDLRDRHAPFGVFLERLARFAERRAGRLAARLSRREIGAIVDFVRGDFDVVPSMEVVVADAMERLASLTREQSLVLEAASEAPRLLVEGAAGSGKTLLAAESARREARRGHRVLLLCFNRLLAGRLWSLVHGEHFSGSVEVQTVHALFRRLIERSSLEDEFVRRSSSMDAELVFELLYPEYAGLACLEDVVTPFDVLIVDEAQDVLGPNVFDVLSLLVFGGLESGHWRLFMDINNQACVYGRLDDELLERVRRLAPTLLLTTNCRNTRPIATQTHVVANPRVRCEARAEGPPVEFETYRDRTGEFEKLRNVVARLDREHLAGEGLTVLFPRTPKRSEEALLERMGLRRYSGEERPAQSFARSAKGTWATVSSFKGLENDVVILVGLDEIDSDWWRAVAYVGMSRARYRLVTLLHEACEARRKERFEAEIARSLGESEVMP
jgi:hypothetical protein